jgi:hypothetical protein
MSTIPQKCPSCSSSLAVTQLTCTSCATVVAGYFVLSPFFRLSPASLQFLETYIRNRGNVKDVERETGESYWAIRRRLDEVITEMGLDVQPEAERSNRRVEILESLSRGEIDVAEAKNLLSQLGRE